MENASKALLMAAGVLIGLLVLSLAVYLFATFGATSAELHKQNDADRINQFNTQFTQYEAKNDVTIYDIVTVANLAKENNTEYELTSQTDGNFFVTVNATGIGSGGSETHLEKMSDEDMQNLLRNEPQVSYTDEDGSTYQALPTYKCSVTINPNTERVSVVQFTRND